MCDYVGLTCFQFSRTDPSAASACPTAPRIPADYSTDTPATPASAPATSRAPDSDAHNRTRSSNSRGHTAPTCCFPFWDWRVYWVNMKHSGDETYAPVLVALILMFLTVSACGEELHFAAPSTVSTGSADTWGVVWHEVKGNPKLRGVQALSWRAAGCTDPAFVRSPDGILTMWFTTIGIRRDANGKFAADGPWIGRARGPDTSSPDLTITPEEPVISVGTVGSWDRYIETISVLSDAKSERYVAWYLGYSARGGATGFVAPALGQMFSLDRAGTKWAHATAPIYRPSPGAWDGVLVTGPTVVQGPDKIWRLYYSGMGSAGGIGLLTSNDGVTWAANGNAPVLEVEPGKWDSQILEQTVIYAHAKYWLWYSGLDSPLSGKTKIAIGLATSDDGVHWSRHLNSPILCAGIKGSWDDSRVLAPDVIEEPDGSLLMCAYGQSKRDISENRSAGSIGFWRSR